MDGMTYSDIAMAARDNNDGFGCCGGGVLWVLMFIVLMGGGNWFNNRNNDCITQADLSNGFNFNDLQSTARDTLDRIDQQSLNLGSELHNYAMNHQAEICDINKLILEGKYDTASKISDLSARMDNCCCTTQRAIDGVNYNISQSVASIKEMLQQDKIEALRDHIGRLELRNELCGVVRYPMNTTYFAGYNPYCNNGMAVGANF